MDTPLDEQYLTWLYGQVGSVKTKARTRTFWSLARQLYTKEFVWLIPNDDNRVEDGRNLRYEFLRTCEIDEDAEWMTLECSMLEMLIALSRTLAFETDGSASAWFWHLIEVMELERFNDREYDSNAQDVIDETLERVIWRNYEPDGQGGLFPLRDAREDQRKVELWYQMNAYLMEQF